VSPGKTAEREGFLKSTKIYIYINYLKIAKI